MSEEKTTSVLLVVRSQVWFQASVVLDTLCPFNVQAIEKFPVPSANAVNLRSWIGKGPCTCDIGATATFYFDHGKESYPVFTWPSVSPKGAGLHTTALMRKLVMDEHTAVFFLEAAASIPINPELFKRVPEKLDEADKILIRKNLSNTQSIVHSLAGAYSLYQYPLVWDYMDERHQWMIIDMNLREGKPSYEEAHIDNWVPFRLDVGAKITDAGFLRDGISEHFGELIKDDLKQPFILLKDSMWHTDIRTRFLLQFWIIEYYADKYDVAPPENREVNIFIENLETIVREKFPAFSDLFRLRKGELMRLTLSQKVQSCFQVMKIQYEDKLFKRAKAVRDHLSHATKYDENELREMELYAREVVRHLIRRDLELQGIFLDGEKKLQSELVEIIPSFPDSSKRISQPFGPLNVI